MRLEEAGDMSPEGGGSPHVYASASRSEQGGGLKRRVEACGGREKRGDGDVDSDLNSWRHRGRERQYATTREREEVRRRGEKEEGRRERKEKETRRPSKCHSAKSSIYLSVQSPNSSFVCHKHEPHG